MRLILKLIAGIIVGIFVGLFAPEFVSRVFITFQVLFGQFIGFSIPLIIMFFIVSGISSLGNESGKLVGLTSSFAYTSTIVAGTLAFTVALLFIPSFVGQHAQEVTGGVALEPFFEFTIDPVFSVMTALVAAFVFGIGIAKTNSPTLKSFFVQGKEIIELLISKVIIPLLPFYIAGIFSDLAAAGTVFATLQTFGFVLFIVVCTHWVWLLILYSVAGVLTGRNPLKALKTMLPAYFTAVGTMSSAATIPLTLRQTKENKIRAEIADFVIPLSATIHLSGSMITIVLCSTAVMVLSSGLDMPTFAQMFPFILALGVMMIAAPGVPGGAIMAALGLLSSMLGFNEVATGLMIALYMAQDSFGTACNVTGDGAIAILVDKLSLVKE